MHSTDLVHVRFAVPEDSVQLVRDLVEKLGGKKLEMPDNEGLVVSPPLPETERPGSMLRGARLRAGLTQKQLAQHIHVPQSHISEYEHNKRPIPQHKAKELAELLKTVTSHFLPR